MPNNKFLPALALAVTLGPVAASAQDSALPGSFSGNIALTNDYVYRGYTQTLENFAVQGGLDWDSGAGFYIGAWASSLNFGENNGLPAAAAVDEATTELDIYTGYAGAIDAFSYDVGFIYYLYPGADSTLDYNFWEGYVKVGYDFGGFSTSAGVAYSPNFFGAVDDGWYYSGGVSIPVGESLSLDANIGYSDYKGGGDYTDWNISTTYSFEWFDTTLGYYDTDVNACTNVCDGRVIFSVSRSF